MALARRRQLAESLTPSAPEPVARDFVDTLDESLDEGLGHLATKADLQAMEDRLMRAIAEMKAEFKGQMLNWAAAILGVGFAIATLAVALILGLN